MVTSLNPVAHLLHRHEKPHPRKDQRQHHQLMAGRTPLATKTTSHGPPQRRPPSLLVRQFLRRRRIYPQPRPRHGKQLHVARLSGRHAPLVRARLTHPRRSNMDLQHDRMVPASQLHRQRTRRRRLLQLGRGLDVVSHDGQSPQRGQHPIQRSSSDGQHCQSAGYA